MSGRNLDLSERISNTRELCRASTPVHFELADIKNHFDQSLSEIHSQYETAESLKQSGKEHECKNVWRSQIVFIEGILDFYLHEMSKYCLYKMFRGEWEKSQQYHTLQIPILKVEEGLAATESKEWFFGYLNERFSRDVFLSSESMRKQLNLIGIGFGDVMHEAFHKASINESQSYGDTVVKNLFARRNAIAHQLDRDHASAEQADITKEYVNQCIEEVVLIVNAIHKIASEK